MYAYYCTMYVLLSHGRLAASLRADGNLLGFVPFKRKRFLPVLLFYYYHGLGPGMNIGVSWLICKVLKNHPSCCQPITLGPSFWYVIFQPLRSIVKFQKPNVDYSTTTKRAELTLVTLATKFVPSRTADKWKWGKNGMKPARGPLRQAGVAATNRRVGTELKRENKGKK